MEIAFNFNAVIFFVLFLIWSGKTWLNVFIKVILFGLTLVNSFYALKLFGVLIVV